MRLWRRRAGKPRTRRVRKLRLLALLSVLGLVCSVSFVYGLVTAIASEIPSLDPRNQVGLEQDGYIYAADGKTLLAILRGRESRVVVDSKEIAPVMKQAIVAVEDRRFWEHRGVDIRGIGRAVWADIREKELVQGGSTITQQFVKNTLTKSDRTISRKLKEAALAWQLERRWSKDRILTAYLNTVYFGNGAYGVERAARVYFDKHAKDLTLPDAALLAGIPANPAAYDPVTRPRAARERRMTVLDLMLEQRLITDDDHARANRAPTPGAEDLVLPGSHRPAFYFTEYVKQQLVPYYGSGKVFGGGLRITTSIDLELQRLARGAIDRWLKKAGPSAALVAIDPRDGRVVAMIGGDSFRESQFNLAVQGERQSGSAFKPFVLATALAQGVSPQTTYTSKPTVINLGDKLWSIANYENSYLGTVDLVDATTFSDNSVYAQLTAHVGPKNIARMAHALGVTSPLNEYFAIGLGVEAVNPLEMARAFSTFANDGARVDGELLGNQPRTVLTVVDGKRVDRNTPVEKQVLDPNDNAWLTSMLTNVVEEGTGKRAQLDDRPAAGKTGTTENYGDAWFVGYTPQLAAAVWVGYPNALRPMLTEYDGAPVAGGTYPALIWQSFMEAALEYLQEKPEYFRSPAYEPAVPVSVVYRDNKLQVDNGYCKDARTVMYVVGYEPRVRADCKPNEVHVPRVVGASREAAEERLAGTPLRAEIITRPAKPGEPLDRVVAQYPASGTLSSWDTVRIVLPKSTHGAVPRVIGLDITNARQRLLGLGLVPLIAALADGSARTVVAQHPRAGVAAAPGMVIRLRVGRG
ncbi:MAG: PBP1A family penicillin-binding protein [Actinomycetota bacterium]|nr:PBP1A family penicillin-binding protein [Actinomycetota bacterium]